MADLIVTKTCRTCKHDLPAFSFYVKDKTTGRLDSECKHCRGQVANTLYALDHPQARCKGFRFPADFTFLVPYKRCARCSTFKGGDKFCSNKKNKSGLSDWCRDCHKQRNDKLKQQRKEFAASIKPVTAEKECTKCHVVKPVAHFYKNKHHASGYLSRCKLCTEQVTKQRYENGKPRIRGRYACKQCGKIMWRRRDYKEWRGLCLKCLKPRSETSSTAERRKLHGRGQYREWRRAVLKRDCYTCQMCGSVKQLEADHIFPWSTHPELRFDVSNGRTLCNTCHKSTPTYGIKMTRASAEAIICRTIDAARRVEKLHP